MLRYISLLLFALNIFSLPVYSLDNRIEAGTTIKVRMDETIDSRVRKAGYRFNVLVENDVKKDNRVLIKSGTKAQAVINKIERPGRGQQKPRLIVTLTTININNRTKEVLTFPLAGEGTTNTRKNTEVINEAKDAVISSNDENIPASIPLVTKGYDITLNKGTPLYFILKEPITL